jgi:hypothetical protein
VNGGDHPLFFFDQDNRQTVGRLDNQEKAGEACDRGITPKRLLRHLVQEMDNIGVDLLEQDGLETQLLRKPSQVILSPSQIAKPVPQKGDPFEPRDR